GGAVARCLGHGADATCLAEPLQPRRRRVGTVSSEIAVANAYAVPREGHPQTPCAHRSPRGAVPVARPGAQPALVLAPAHPRPLREHRPPEVGGGPARAAGHAERADARGPEPDRW